MFLVFPQKLHYFFNKQLSQIFLYYSKFLKTADNNSRLLRRRKDDAEDNYHYFNHIRKERGFLQKTVNPLLGSIFQYALTA